MAGGGFFGKFLPVINGNSQTFSPPVIENCFYFLAGIFVITKNAFFKQFFVRRDHIKKVLLPQYY